MAASDGAGVGPGSTSSTWIRGKERKEEEDYHDEDDARSDDSADSDVSDASTGSEATPKATNRWP